MASHPVTLELQPADNERLANLCGQFDEHLRQIDGGRLTALQLHRPFGPRPLGFVRVQGAEQRVVGKP